MKQLITATYVIIFLITPAISTVCYSAETVENPGYIQLANMNDDPSTIIHLNCLDGGTENQIKCYIGELRIWGNADIVKEENIEKKLQDVTEQEKQKGLEEIQETMCTEEAMERARLIAEVNPFLSAIKKQQELFCKQPTFSALMRLLEESTKHGSKTCLMSINAGVGQFTYNVETRRWVSKVGPSGQCGGINTKEIYKDGESSAAGWVYTTLGVATKKDAHKVCAVVYDGKLYKYRSASTDIPKYYKVNCTYVNF